MSIYLHHRSTTLAAVLTGSACFAGSAFFFTACETEKSAPSAASAPAGSAPAGSAPAGSARPKAALSPVAEEREDREKANVNANAAQNLYQFSLDTIDGEAYPLESVRGKVVLVVNVASECGFTPQYSELQTLYERYQAKGLVVLGLPSNDFGGQEPGSNEEIKAFCESKFDVTFPMFSKVSVKGPGQHPLYRWLTKDHGEVTWNFNKFLIDRHGKIVQRFESAVKPLSAELIGAVDAALAGT